MHYFVDGYNLLFKESWGRSGNSLQDARKRLIEELDTLASSLNLTLTVVFDAPLQSDDIRRGHFQSIEIIFTARGQTADDYLVDCADAHGKKAIIVTSDRTIAYKAKCAGSSVESVHNFLVHMRKKSRNKLAKSNKLYAMSKKPEAPKLEVIPEVQEIETPIDMKNLPSLANIPAWEKIFTKKREKLT